MAERWSDLILQLMNWPRPRRFVRPTRNDHSESVTPSAENASHKDKVAQAASLSANASHKDKVAQAASLSTNASHRQAACATLPESDYFNPHNAVSTARRNLPHWRQVNAWYFVTYRLADSLPGHRIQEPQEERELWLSSHPEPRNDTTMREYWSRFGGRIHDLLDAGAGNCWLRRVDVQQIVRENLAYHAGDRYTLDAWVVMPNHVHVLVRPHHGIELSKILHTWKSFTALRINRILQRCGTLWQAESYDHLVRSSASFVAIREYILENPIKANLKPHEYHDAMIQSILVWRL